MHLSASKQALWIWPEFIFLSEDRGQASKAIQGRLKCECVYVLTHMAKYTFTFPLLGWRRESYIDSMHNPRPPFNMDHCYTAAGWPGWLLAHY